MTDSFATSSSPTTMNIIETLVQSPVYLDEDHIRKNVIPTILITIVVVSCIYCVSFPLIANRLIQIEEEKEEDNSTNKKMNDSNNNNINNNKKTSSMMMDRRKFAYQITNLITNAFLGLLGIYCQYFVLPSSSVVEAATTETTETTTTTTTTTTVQQKIEGWIDFYPLGAIQIGFQIWAIIIGLLFVKESTSMLLHHIAVIFAGSKSVFLTNGFRYYAPLALGMTELSSIPLSVMNSFKNSPKWQSKYPQHYLASRLVFSFSFLVIRIGIFVPQHIEYLVYSFLLTYHAQLDHVGILYKGFMTIAWIGAVFLLILQLYWGYLIIKGLSNFALAKVNRVQQQSATRTATKVLEKNKRI